MPYHPPGDNPPEDPWLWNTTPVPTDRAATPIVVARYNAQAASGKQFQNLTSLRCVSIHRSIGTDPGRAVFRYAFDGQNANSPQSIEQALSTSVRLSEAINTGDQLVVKGIKPDGTNEFLFYGKALKFGFKLQGQVEQVFMTAIGIAKEFWNTPIAGAKIRDGSNVATGADIQTDVLAQFNPKGLPNATEKANWVTPQIEDQAGDFQYPSFMDPNIVRDPDVRDYWQLNTGVRWLVFSHYDGSTPLTLPDGSQLDSLLMSLEPNGATVDPGDPSTYTPKPIMLSDKPMTGRDWPSVLNDLLKDRGFGMEWRLAGVSDDGKLPQVSLRIFRLQLGTLRNVYLQQRGSFFDPTLSNVGEGEIERDASQVINRWDVYGALNKYEAGFVLTQLFPMQASDGNSVASIALYDRNSAAFSYNSDAYRLFGLDETGEGSYAIGSTTEVNKPTNLDQVLGTPINNKAVYATRRRKPIGELLSLDSNGKARRYQLAISTDYMGTIPGVWDGSGTWQVIEGGFSLLKDRLGIRITADNPNGWKIGKSNEPTAPFPEGVVKVVESLSNPGAVNKKFYLRLVAVIEGDSAVKGTADKTDNSVLTTTVARQIDARDRYEKNTVDKSSPFNTTGADQVVRDDTDNATAEAIANRAATEAGILEGPIKIPRFTNFYQLGDRISQIVGRGLGFRTDNGSSQSATAAVYPVIVAIDQIFEPEQQTVLHLSDQDGHRHKIEPKIRRGR